MQVKQDIIRTAAIARIIMYANYNDANDGNPGDVDWWNIEPALRGVLGLLANQHDGSAVSAKAAADYAAALPGAAQLRSQIREALAAPGATVKGVVTAFFDTHNPSAIYDIDMAVAAALEGPAGDSGASAAEAALASLKMDIVHNAVVNAVAGMENTSTVAGLADAVMEVFGDYGAELPHLSVLRAAVRGYLGDRLLTDAETKMEVVTALLGDYPVMTMDAQVAMALSGGRMADADMDDDGNGVTTDPDPGTTDPDPGTTDPVVMTDQEMVDDFLTMSGIRTSGLGGNQIDAIVLDAGAPTMVGGVSLQGGRVTVGAATSVGEFGYWLENSFVIGAYMRGTDIETFSVGMPAGSNPSPPATGTTAKWDGAMTGYWNAAADAPDTGEMAATGQARITVTFLAGLGSTPTAALELAGVKAGGAAVAIVPPASGDDVMWSGLGITSGAFSDPDNDDDAFIRGRFLTGHDAVVGELKHTQADNGTSGTLNAAFGACTGGC
jgi:hypothetical protein